MEGFFAEWGYFVVFFLVLIESIPLLGYFMPGAILILFAGVLVKGGVLSLFPVIIAATLGALVGDILMYLVGRHYGYDFLRRHGKLFFLPEARLEKARALILNHRTKAIILNRFWGFTRPIGPFIAGAAHVPFAFYSVLSVLSALAWVTILVFAGIAFSVSLDALSRYMSVIFITVILLSGLIFYGYNFINRSHTVFKKYHIYILIFNIISMLVFAATLDNVINRDFMNSIDATALHFFSDSQSAWLLPIMVFTTSLGDPFFLLASSVVLIGFMLYKRSWYGALLASCALGAGLVLQHVFKVLTDIERPLSPLVNTLYASFPSGHATLITIFMLLTARLLGGALHTKATKISLYAGTAFIILIVGVSRVYLRAHWASDVIAGICLGVFSVTFFALFLRGIIWSHSSLLSIFRKHQLPLK